MKRLFRLFPKQKRLEKAIKKKTRNRPHVSLASIYRSNQTICDDRTLEEFGLGGIATCKPTSYIHPGLKKWAEEKNTKLVKKRDL